MTEGMDVSESSFQAILQGVHLADFFVQSHVQAHEQLHVPLQARIPVTFYWGQIILFIGVKFSFL